MNKYKDFAFALQSFFQDYLVKECRASNNTIRAYRDTFVLFIDFMNSIHKINPDKIVFESINKDLVLEFINWLQSDKNNSPNTINSRYAAIRSFFKYMLYIDPTHMEQWKIICSIKLTKAKIKPVKHLTISGIKCIFEQINTSTTRGRRDLTLLSLLYNTGARVQELIDLTPYSIRKVQPYYVELFGKGAKKRIVPIDDAIMALLNSYMKDNGLNLPGREHHPLFYNSWGNKLSNPGINYILNKYASEVRKIDKELMPESISPHCFRHSRAMHLLQAGVNLIYIRDILGHVSIQTTEIYARIDSKHKQDALEKAYIDVGISEPKKKSWEKNTKLKSFLKSLC